MVFPLILNIYLHVIQQRESHERTGLSFMPLAESKAIRSSEASRSIPSSNIKFRATETLDPIIQKMVHSKDTIDNLPKFIDLINKVAVPHLKTVYEDLKLGIQLEEKKKKKVMFFEKLFSHQHYIELKMMNHGFSTLQNKTSKTDGMIETKKAKGAALFHSFLSSKIMVNKCSIFSNMKAIIEAEFTKTIKDKVFDQIKPKTSPTHTTESPIKSQKSSKISMGIEEEFTEENREKIGNLLENLNKKCHDLERVGEKAFNQWKTYSLSKEKSNILLSFSLRNIVNKTLVRSFEKIKCFQKKEDNKSFSKKIMNFSNVLHTINKKLWFEKLSTFSQIKKTQSPFRYVKQLSKLFTTLRNVMQRRLITGVNAMKSILMVQNLQKNEALKRFLVISANIQKNNLRSLFLQMRENTFMQKMEKINLTNRLKGRILIGCYKQSPLYSLKNAFLKFKVRTDPFLVKRAIDRFFFFFIFIV